MTHKLVKLGDLIEPAPVRRAGQRQFHILSMTMHRGLVEQSGKFKKRIASANTSSYKVVSHGQFVVGFPIDEGVLSFQTLYPEAIVSPAYGVWNLKEQVSSRYLERYLRSPQALTYYASKLRGTTARRRSLPNDTFLALTVPLPSVAEQQKIADVLDKVDVLRGKRRETISLLDELTQCIFLDMFGNPVRNDRSWPQVNEVLSVTFSRSDGVRKV